jgi:hypothetical protein
MDSNYLCLNEVISIVLVCVWYNCLDYWRVCFIVIDDMWVVLTHKMSVLSKLGLLEDVYGF